MRWLQIWLVLGLLVAFVGCQEPPRLHILAWADGLDMERVVEFERQTGTRVVVTTYRSVAAAREVLATESVDVVLGGAELLDSLQAEGALLPLRGLDFQEVLLPEIVPGWPTPADRDFRVPYGLTPIGLAWRADRLGEDFEPSWEIFDEPRWAGQMTMLRHHGWLAASWLAAEGLDLNQADPQEFSSRLERWSPRLKNLVMLDFDLYPAALKAGSLSVAQAVGAHIYRLVRADQLARQARAKNRGEVEKQPLWVRFGLLPGKVVVVAEEWAVPVKSRQPELAKRWIRWVHEPAQAAAAMRETGYWIPNRQALELLETDEATAIVRLEWAEAMRQRGLVLRDGPGQRAWVEAVRSEIVRSGVRVP